MFYSDYRQHDTADGDGVRVSLYVSGCTLHCRGCFNEKTWVLNYGDEFTDEVLEELISDCKKPYIRGLSLLGGDPFEKENQEEVLRIVKRFREEFGDTKDIWVWTGRKIEDLLDETCRDCTKYTKDILCNIDFLIDGPFVLSKRNLMLKYAGSENQRRLDLRNINTPHDLCSISDWDKLDCEVK